MINNFPTTNLDNDTTTRSEAKFFRVADPGVERARIQKVGSGFSPDPAIAFELLRNYITQKVRIPQISRLFSNQ